MRVSVSATEWGERGRLSDSHLSGRAIRRLLPRREDRQDPAARAVVEGAGFELTTGQLRVAGGRWAVHGLGLHSALRERTWQAQRSCRSGNFPCPYVLQAYKWNYWTHGGYFFNTQLRKDCFILFRVEKMVGLENACAAAKQLFGKRLPMSFR